MLKKIILAAFVLMLTIPAYFAGLHQAVSQATPKMHRIVLQVSRDDAEGMNLALGNAINAKHYYDGKKEALQVEIVAYGPGITMFRSDTSPVKDRIEDAKKEIPGIVLSMCANSKAAAEKREGITITPLPGVGVVPAGIVRVVQLQEEGWTYVRP